LSIRAAGCIAPQVQKLKVDTASAMLEMDQILKANELSISLVAAIPSFAIAGGCLFYLGRRVASRSLLFLCLHACRRFCVVCACLHVWCVWGGGGALRQGSNPSTLCLARAAHAFPA
jgi:hypothetical protein